MDRLSGEYNRGYSQAIMDLKDVFNYVNYDLVHHHKRMNYKLAQELLSCCLENREKLRDNWNGFIRWNTQKQEFEYYQKKNLDMSEIKIYNSKYARSKL